MEEQKGCYTDEESNAINDPHPYWEKIVPNVFMGTLIHWRREQNKVFGQPQNL